jgi:hypothetical protein
MITLRFNESKATSLLPSSLNDDSDYVLLHAYDHDHDHDDGHDDGRDHDHDDRVHEVMRGPSFMKLMLSLYI